MAQHAQVAQIMILFSWKDEDITELKMINYFTHRTVSST